VVLLSCSGSNRMTGGFNVRTFRLQLLPLLLCLFVLHTPSTHAAPNPEASKVTAIAKDLLNKGRDLLLSYRNFYKDIEAHPERYEETRQAILLDLIFAQEQKDLRAAELAAAIQDKVTILTTQLVLPHAVLLHQGILSLVADYKGQACAPGGNPALCIGGTWNR